MPLQFVAWSPGIARGQTCNAFCRNWQLTSALFISLRHSVTLPCRRNCCTRPASALSAMRGSDSMNDLTLLGPWVRRFLLEHLVAERNLARNTQRSYRDALTLLIPFVADKLHPPVDRLTVVDVSADLVRLFLADLEQSRHCAITTRNQRLAAVHALAGFVENTVRNTLPGAHRSDPFRSRRPARQLSPIWTNRRWMRSWPRPIAKPPRAVATSYAVSLQLRGTRRGGRSGAHRRTGPGWRLSEDPR